MLFFSFRVCMCVFWDAWSGGVMSVQTIQCRPTLVYTKSRDQIEWTSCPFNY